MSTVHRMRNIFASDGRAVIVAIDHGLLDGPIAGIENPSGVIEAVTAGGADAILTSYGIASTFVTELSGVGLILRGDGASTNLGTPSDGSLDDLFFTVEDALRIGADALVATALPGSPKEETTLRNLAHLVRDAHRWGLPVLGEMVPGGFDSPADLRSIEAIAFASRLGAELGADFIKAPYADGYEEVTSKTFVPVVILGGSKGDERDTLVNIHAAMRAGAKGVAMGRNVFQASDPLAMTSAVAAIVHDEASVDDAAAMLAGS